MKWNITLILKEKLTENSLVKFVVVVFVVVASHDKWLADNI